MATQLANMLVHYVNQTAGLSAPAAVAAKADGGGDAIVDGFYPVRRAALAVRWLSW